MSTSIPTTTTTLIDVSNDEPFLTENTILYIVIGALTCLICIVSGVCLRYYCRLVSAKKQEKTMVDLFGHQSADADNENAAPADTQAAADTKTVSFQAADSNGSMFEMNSNVLSLSPQAAQEIRRAVSTPDQPQQPYNMQHLQTSKSCRTLIQIPPQDALQNMGSRSCMSLTEQPRHTHMHVQSQLSDTLVHLRKNI